jgi:hypothetical protein
MPMVQLPCARGSIPVAFANGAPQLLSCAAPERRGHKTHELVNVCAASNNGISSCDSAGDCGRRSILASVAAAGNVVLSSHGTPDYNLLIHDTCVEQ